MQKQKVGQEAITKIKYAVKLLQQQTPQGNCFLSQREIGEVVGYSRRTVNVALCHYIKHKCRRCIANVIHKRATYRV